MMHLITAILAGLYAALMAAYAVGWWVQRGRWQCIPKTGGLPSVTVVVAARNEAANIGALLESLAAQDYPQEAFEVIIVDDHSDDDTAGIAERAALPNARVLRLAGLSSQSSGKKAALAAGMRTATGDILITTDADCTAPPGWLHAMVRAFANPRIQVGAGPVNYRFARGVCYLFQSLDFAAMQGITAATAVLRLGTMSNGANLAFRRAAFEEVEGYAGTTHLASGDDYLLTHKMVRRWGAGCITYVARRDAVITTDAQPKWRALLRQRVRWASKSGKYGDHRQTAVLLLVYIFNVWLIVLAASGYWMLAGWTLLAKTVLETAFLLPVLRFFGKAREIIAFPFLQPLHIFYVALAGFLGMRGSYSWKGRRLR